MKKAISIALSLCILLASFSGALIGTVVADNSTISYYENAENWEMYYKNATLGTNPRPADSTWPSRSQNTDATYCYTGSSESVLFHLNDARMALPLTVKRDTDYTFRFRYYAPNENASSTYYLKNIGIYTNGAVFDANGNLSSGTKIKSFSDQKAVNAWTTVTLHFNSGSNEKVYFTAHSGGNSKDYNVYFDDIIFLEHVPNWEVTKGTDKVNVTGSGITKGLLLDNWMAVSYNTDSAYVNPNGEDNVSLKVNANQYVSYKFTVEQNKDYNFLFSYYVPSSENASDYLTNAGIYASGATLGTGALATATVSDENKWTKVNMTFNSGNNTELYFAAKVVAAKASNIVYLDDLKVAPALTPDYYEDANNWKIFKNNVTFGTVDTTNWFSKTTINYGDEYVSVDQSIRIKANAAIAALPITVQPGRKYKLTFKYFIPSATAAPSTGDILRGLGIYTSSGKINAGTPTNNLSTVADYSTKGAWTDIELTFESSTNSTVYLATWFGSGSDPRYVYFDDFKLTQTVDLTHYEAQENWEFYKYNKSGDGKTSTPTLGGGKFGDGWEKALTLYDYEGEEVAVATNINGGIAAIPFEVEANKYYSLTFKYFIPKDEPYSQYIDNGNKAYMKSIGVYVEGSTFNSGNLSSAASTRLAAANKDAKATVDGQWTDMTINFNSKENTKVYFAAYCAFGASSANKAYFADMALTEYPADWALFGSYDGDKVVNVETAAAPYYNWETITESGFVAEDANDDTSIKLNANGSAFAHKLDAVEANSRYTLTFKYFVPETSVKEDNFLSFAGVYAEGTTVTEGAALKCTEISTKGEWTEATVTFDTKDNTSVYFGAVVTAGDPYTVYIDAIELTEVSSLQTSYNSTAAIRAANDAEGYVQKNGLRTYNQVLIDYIEGKEIVEYGSIVIRQGYLQTKFGKNTDPEFTDVSGEETLIDFVGSGVGLGVAYRTEDAESVSITTQMVAFDGAFDKLWESTSSEKVFTSYITGMPEENYDEEYLVRAYAIDKDGNVYYGNTSSISVFKVANAIDKASEVSDTDKNAFDAFVGASDTTKEEYITWCTNNSTSTGDLFTALNDAQ